MYNVLTSNFANNGINNLKGICISRYPAIRQGFRGPEFTPLMPDAGLLKEFKEEEIGWPEYVKRYSAQLMCLDPQRTLDRLREIAAKIQGVEPSEAIVILLCHESAKPGDETECHRRLVADWYKSTLDLYIPEWYKGIQSAPV